MPSKQANKMIKESLSKVGVQQAKMGRKYGVHRTMIGKFIKKSKIDVDKTKIGFKVQSLIQAKRREHKGSWNS